LKKLRNKSWKDRHARKKGLIEVYRRSRYGIVQTSPVGSRKYTVTANRKLAKNVYRGRVKEIIAPSNFSLYQNPNETLKYIEDIKIAVKNSMPVRIDMEQIEVLSIDTIMYFLAILKKLKVTGLNYSCSGSLPKNEECKHLLRASGFLNYVKSKDRRADLTHESNIVRIISGQNSDGETASKICSFVISKLNLTRLETFDLYIIIMELMSNTRLHAYINSSKFITDWYVFVYYLPEKKSVRFIFMDTGSGIPSTIRKRLLEPTKTLIGLNTHTNYIKSAMKGTYLRSRTGESYRGTGLPTINSLSQESYIKDLTIISNRGYYTETRRGDGDKWGDDDLNFGLDGTLFYWEMCKGEYNESD